LSGGLDSFIAWRLLGQPKAIYFSIGHEAENRELLKVWKIRKDFSDSIIINNDLKLRNWEYANAYIPYRNLFFIMLASYYSLNVVLSQILEYAPDKNQSFYRKTEKLLKEITTGSFQELKTNEVKVWTPFANYTKTELIREYSKKFDVKELTKYTVSCYGGDEKNCGECGACINRHIAMVNNGIEEQYETIPDIQKMKSKWSIKDFKFDNVKMYVKRWLEIKQYEGNKSSR